MPKEKRITSCGNSAAITIAADELAHMNRAQGDTITITKAAHNRLIIKPAQRRTNGKKPRRYLH